MMRSNAVDLVSQLMLANSKDSLRFTHIFTKLFCTAFHILRSHTTQICVAQPSRYPTSPTRRTLYIMRCFNARSLVSLSFIGTFLSSLVNSQLTVQANNQGTPYLSAHARFSEQ